MAWSVSARAAQSAGARVPALAAAIGQVRQQLQAGNWEAAQRRLQALLPQYPREAALYDLLGVAEAAQNEVRRARRDFTHAIGLDPHLAGAYLNLIRLQMGTGDTAGALAACNRLLAFQPENPEANLASAELLLERGQYAESLQRCRRLPPARQGAPAVMALECGDESGLGHLRRADALAARLLGRPDLQEQDLAWLLPALQRQKKLDLQVELLEGLERRGRASVTGRDRLAALDVALGRYQAARDELRQLQHEDPDNAAYLLQLAQVAAQQKDVTGALGYLAHARALQPSNGAIPFLMAGLCKQKGMLVQAYRFYSDAARLTPGNAEYWKALGEAAMPLPTHAAEAIADFRRYQELRPGDPWGALYTARALLNAGRPGEAAPQLRRLTGQPELAAAARFSLGVLELKQGQLAAAGRDLRQSLHLDATEPNARAQLGVVEVQEHAYAAAERDLEAAIRQDPENFPANFNLALVYQRLHDGRAAAQRERVQELRKLQARQRAEAMTLIRVVPHAERP